MTDDELLDVFWEQHELACEYADEVQAQRVPEDDNEED